MKRKLLAILLSGFAAIGADWHEEFNVALDLRVMSKYLTYGFDVYDGKPAVSGTLSFDFGPTGVYGGARYTMPLTGGNAYEPFLPSEPAYSRADATQWEYLIGYRHIILEGETAQTRCSLSYSYSDWGTVRYGGTKLVSGADHDSQELALDLRMTNLRPFGLVIVPRYEIAYLFEPPGAEGNIAGGKGKWGFLHTFGMWWYLAIAEVPIAISTNIIYDDAAISDLHDWVRMVSGLSAEFDLGKNRGSITPGIYYQKAFRDGTTAPYIDDDFYAMLTYSINF